MALQSGVVLWAQWRTIIAGGADFFDQMQNSTTFAQLLMLLGATLACVFAAVSPAAAQSASCRRLEQTLANLDRNSSFQDVRQATREARAVGQQVQRNESRYVRSGCNDDAKAGRQLSRECRALAKEITDGRARYEQLVSGVQTGNAVAEQREALLQEIARFGCNTRGRPQQNGRGNLIDQLFNTFGSNPNDEDDTGNDYIEDGWDPWGGSYHTVRTLCVRKTDGFYWPISYSTLTDYVANDAEQCRSMCPGLDVELYYYDNPGQEPEQMINVYGEPYTALPNAFKFRTEIDKTASCRPATNYGSIQIVDNGDGQSRAVIEFAGASFPLPLRDPRRQVEVRQAVVDPAHFVNVPLPRRRPLAPGEEPVAVPIAPVAANQSRIVEFGDKRVRVVGPETPYAPSAAAGT